MMIEHPRTTNRSEGQYTVATTKCSCNNKHSSGECGALFSQLCERALAVPIQVADEVSGHGLAIG
jgi:hypothetical protein